MNYRKTADSILDHLNMQIDAMTTEDVMERPNVIAIETLYAELCGDFPEEVAQKIAVNTKIDISKDVPREDVEHYMQGFARIVVNLYNKLPDNPVIKEAFLRGLSAEL